MLLPLAVMAGVGGPRGGRGRDRDGHGLPRREAERPEPFGHRHRDVRQQGDALRGERRPLGQDDDGDDNSEPFRGDSIDRTGEEVSLAEGANGIAVTVTAEDGTTTRIYTVTVTLDNGLAGLVILFHLDWPGNSVNGAPDPIHDRSIVVPYQRKIRGH